MKALNFIVLTLLLQTVSIAQIQVDLFSGMIGFHQLESGDFVPIWGYGTMASGIITLPAPLLEFYVGDQVDVNMTNVSTEAHTIHLHGLDVDQNNDGVPHTSFYVFTGESATYSFDASYPGNFLYHCHVTTTLHLTMGMYGMIVVRYSDNQLYDNGPTYEREYTFLASDLEIDTNENPSGAYPFHEIRPDYFMLNGFSGTQLATEPSQIVYYEEGDKVLLRLGSMAYSKVVFNFPPELGAEVFMSDGRVLPNSFTTEELEVYPGERFSVVIQPPNDYDGTIQATYFSMINKEELHTNNIIVQEGEPSKVDDVVSEGFKVYPNPAHLEFTIETDEANSQYSLFDAQGKEVWSRIFRKGQTRIGVSDLPNGVYLLRNRQLGSSQRVIINH